MKSRFYIICAALAAGSISLTSCYDPYYTGGLGATSSTYRSTTYQPGYVARTLPQGYSTVVIDDTRYYHHDGVYYRPRGSSYVVVDHPNPRRDRDRFRDRDRDRTPDRYERRYERNTWSSRDDRRDSRRLDRRDRRYDGVPDRYDSSTRYSEEVQVIRQLPRNHRVLRYQGQPYYRVGDTYYREREGAYIRVPAPY